MDRVLRFIPPLTITEQEIDIALKVLDQSYPHRADQTDET